MKELVMSALFLGATAMGCSSVAKTSGVAQPSSAVSPSAKTPQPEVVNLEGIPSRVSLPVNSKPVSSLPRAVVYRMSGDYADNVPVTLRPDGTLLSFPAPTDISDNSRPVKLANGWWLDRRGVSNGTVFLRYTYSEYSKLPEVPSQNELKEAILPGARVVEAISLPMTLQEAIADTTAVNLYLSKSRLRLAE